MLYTLYVPNDDGTDACWTPVWYYVHTTTVKFKSIINIYPHIKNSLRKQIEYITICITWICKYQPEHQFNIYIHIRAFPFHFFNKIERIKCTTTQQNLESVHAVQLHVKKGGRSGSNATSTHDSRSWWWWSRMERWSRGGPPLSPPSVVVVG